MAFTANAQTNNLNVKAIIAKYLNKNVGESTAKKTRAQEVCIKQANYLDNGSGLLLNSETFYDYVTKRASTTIFEFDLFLSDLNTKADKNRTYLYDNNLAFDSSYVLNTFDANDRLLLSVNVSFFNNALDTSDYTRFKYSGANTDPDSVIYYTKDANNNIVASNITKNTISNNKITQSKVYADDGSGSIGLLQTINTTFNANGKITQQSSDFDLGGVPGQIVQKNYYLASGFIDSTGVTLSAFFMNNPLSGTKNFYNANYSKGYTKQYEAGDDLTNPTFNLLQTSEFDINTDGKTTRLLTKNNNGNDSSIIDEAFFSYTSNKNISNVYMRTMDTLTGIWSPINDSTYFTYTSLFTTANANIAKTVTSLTCLPNPVVNSAYLNYAGNKASKGIITITDITGKVVLSKEANLVNGNSIITLNTETLTNGLYVCSLSIDGALQQSIKIAK